MIEYDTSSYSFEKLTDMKFNGNINALSVFGKSGFSVGGNFTAVFLNGEQHNISYFAIYDVSLYLLIFFLFFFLIDY